MCKLNRNCWNNFDTRFLGFLTQYRKKTYPHRLSQKSLHDWSHFNCYSPLPEIVVKFWIAKNGNSNNKRTVKIESVIAALKGMVRMFTKLNSSERESLQKLLAIDAHKALEKFQQILENEKHETWDACQCQELKRKGRLNIRRNRSKTITKFRHCNI